MASVWSRSLWQCGQPKMPSYNDIRFNWTAPLPGQPEEHLTFGRSHKAAILTTIPCFAIGRCKRQDPILLAPSVSFIQAI